MDTKAQYCMYRLAYYFVTKEHYNMLHINHQHDEVWLEKRESKQTNIIRLIPKGYHWKNRLKQDIAKVFQRVRMMGNLWTGKHISIYNIYMTDIAPVDNWEPLKKPMILQGKKSLWMYLFYFTSDNYIDEEQRLIQKIHATPIAHQVLPEKTIQEKDIAFYKESFTQMEETRRQDIKNTLTFGKPYMTLLCVMISVGMFLMLALQSSGMHTDTFIQYGAIYYPAIVHGEWWRLVTSVFLHVGFLHLLFNMVALYDIGRVTERIYGSIRFALIFVIASVSGSMASLVLQPTISAGASGAIFGLFGALLYFGIHHPRLFHQTMGHRIILLLLMNIAFGLMFPHIDLLAYLGGLIGGFLGSITVSLPHQRHPQWQIIAMIFVVALNTALWFIV